MDLCLSLSFTCSRYIPTLCRFHGCVCVRAFIYENHIPPLFLLRSYMLCARVSGGGRKGLRVLCMWIYHEHSRNHAGAAAAAVLFVINTCVLVAQLDRVLAHGKSVLASFVCRWPQSLSSYMLTHTQSFLFPAK